MTPNTVIPDVTILLAGDSGDGIQLTGSQFTETAALFGNDVSTFPNFPAEIRAPQGTLAGVSGFQLHFGSIEINTPGDFYDVLVVMNAATRSTMVGHIRVELSGAGARVLGAEIAHRTAYAEAELFGSAPCYMGKSASKAAAEITAITNEIIRT
jgi:Pyruvate/2-oxoacid:ferredoxin oxidoreductase gamma subunit